MSKYWEAFGEQTFDFWRGVKAGVDAYATWRNGEQLVGALEVPKKEVFAEIDEACMGNRSVNKLYDAALKYMEETDQKPENLDKMGDAAWELVELIRDNALTILHDYSEIVDEKLERFNG